MIQSSLLSVCLFVLHALLQITLLLFHLFPSWWTAEFSTCEIRKEKTKKKNIMFFWPPKWTRVPKIGIYQEVHFSLIHRVNFQHVDRTKRDEPKKEPTVFSYGIMSLEISIEAMNLITLQVFITLKNCKLRVWTRILFPWFRSCSLQRSISQ